MRPSLALGSALAAAVLLTATPTSALIYTGPTLYLKQPHDGAADVPLDTRIWLDVQTATESLNYVDARTPILHGPDGDIELGAPTQIVTPRGDLLVYTPAAPLAPDTAYELQTCSDGRCDHRLGRFRTGAAGDSQPPEVPDVERVFTVNGQIRVDITGDVDGILVVDRSASPFVGEARRGSVLGVAVPPEATPLDLRINDLPEDRHDLRFAVYDLSGNFSGWSDAHPVEPEEQFMCAVAPHAAPPAALLLVPLLLRRRRRP